MSRRAFVPWSDDDMGLLCALYSDTDDGELAIKFGRSRSAVYQKAKSLELKKSRAFLARTAKHKAAPPGGVLIAFDGTVLPAWVVGVRTHFIRDD